MPAKLFFFALLHVANSRNPFLNLIHLFFFVVFYFLFLFIFIFCFFCCIFFIFFIFLFFLFFLFFSIFSLFLWLKSWRFQHMSRFGVFIILFHLAHCFLWSKSWKTVFFARNDAKPFVIFNELERKKNQESVSRVRELDHCVWIKIPKLFVKIDLFFFWSKISHSVIRLPQNQKKDPFQHLLMNFVGFVLLLRLRSVGRFFWREAGIHRMRFYFLRRKQSKTHHKKICPWPHASRISSLAACCSAFDIKGISPIIGNCFCFFSWEMKSFDV